MINKSRRGFLAGFGLLTFGAFEQRVMAAAGVTTPTDLEPGKVGYFVEPTGIGNALIKLSCRNAPKNIVQFQTLYNTYFVNESQAEEARLIQCYNLLKHMTIPEVHISIGSQCIKGHFIVIDAFGDLNFYAPWENENQRRFALCSSKLPGKWSSQHKNWRRVRLNLSDANEPYIKDFNNKILWSIVKADFSEYYEGHDAYLNLLYGVISNMAKKLPHLCYIEPHASQNFNCAALAVDIGNLKLEEMPIFEEFILPFFQLRRINRQLQSKSFSCAAKGTNG